MKRVALPPIIVLTLCLTVATLTAAPLDSAAEPTASNRLGETPLHLAVAARDLERATRLVAAGADLNAGDTGGHTPLHYAAFRNDPRLLNLLLTHGANANAADQNGETPLHTAARLARVDAVLLLLAHGADPNARNATGQSPLHVLGAAARPDVDEVQQDLVRLSALLIAAGADPNLLDAAGQIAWPRPAPRGDEQRTPPGYPTLTQIAQILADRAAQYPALCQRIDLGLSQQSRNIYALNISDNVGTQEDEPEFKWVANMHGDETTGLVLCLYMIDHLLQNYGADPRVTNLVDSLDIWIVPTMNPDGYYNNTRYNAQGYDLNRNFPEGVDGDPNTPTGRPTEVQRIMNWCFGQSFTVSANYHGGALLVNYPFDNDGLGSVFSPTPDEDLFVFISEEYSRYNSPMWNSSSFYHGISNGAAWYSIDGGMQDWNYRYMGCNDVTIEVSATKAPAYSLMPTFWNQNRDSMLSYMETALIGVRGLVVAGDTGAPLPATVAVVGRDHDIFTDPDVGDYHRMLMPGLYSLTFAAAGYPTLLVENVAVAEGPATRLDVVLGPATALTYPNGDESLELGRPVIITWDGAAATSYQLQFSPNFGVVGVDTDDFESGALGSQYTLGGDANWCVATGMTHGGTYAARAGAITHNQQTWMTRTASEGTIDFWYRISSEPGYDFFNFYIGAQRIVHVSGNSAWTHVVRALPAGTHLLKWEYVKDSGVSGGSDTVWIDDLTLSGDQTAWQPLGFTEPGATTFAWTPDQLTEAGKVRVRSVYDGGAHGVWDQSDAVFQVIEPQAPLSGDLNCDGLVNALDINPFVLALTNPAAYHAAHPLCDITAADCNDDGEINALDINPFVRMLTR